MMPTRRALLVGIARVGGAISAASLTSGCASLFLPRELTFSAADLQRRMSERFPWRKTFYSLFDVNLTNPQINLNGARGRVGSAFDVDIRMLGFNRAINGRIGLSGVPQYDNDKRALFLREASIDELAINGVPQAFNNDFQRLVRTLAVDVLNDTPLYAFKPDDAQVMGLSVRPGDIRVTADRLIIGLVPQR